MSPSGNAPLWSILICTLVRREGKFLKLLGQLLSQAEASPEPVEVVALQNQGELLLDAYRQALLESARGKYLCFVDDDDELAESYVSSIVEALLLDPDMVGWTHACTGLSMPFTRVSLAEDAEDPLVYTRRFTHMNPVRSALAKQGSFLGHGPGYTGEDTGFVDSVLPLLKTEVCLTRIVYTYHWLFSDTTQNGPQQPGLPHARPVIDSPCFRWFS